MDKLIRRFGLQGVFVFLCFGAGRAQIPVEISAGHTSYYYQHSFSGKFHSNKQIGFFHTSSVLIPYDKSRTNEIMSQSYITYPISARWTSGIGSIFTPLARVRPSVFLQYFIKTKTSAILVYPRADIWDNPNFELMGFIEHRKFLSDAMKLYFRLQYMTTWSLQQHVRSYQYLRVGSDREKIGFGLAANVDQYGKSGTNYCSVGFYIRTEL